MRSTEEVVNHQLRAFSEDLDAILSDYDNNSCVMTQNGTFRGENEIRSFFAEFVRSLPVGLLDAFNVKLTYIDEEVAYITWESNPSFPMVTDTFIVRNDKILYQTFAGYSAG